MNYKFRKKLNEDVTNNSFEEKVAYAKQQLQNGANPNDVFDEVYDFQEGFAAVKLKGKYNSINTNGELLSDRWFDWVSDFCNGCAIVRLRNQWGSRYNFINTNGDIISNIWFNNVDDFSEGFARVHRIDEEIGEDNFINTNGKLLCDVWFNAVWRFHEGFAKVLSWRKFNFVNTDGNILRNDLWFEDAEDFENGFAEVKLNGKWYLIDAKGNLYDEDENPIENVTENRRRVLRITESQLRNTIKKVVTQYLNESKRR